MKLPNHAYYLFLPVTPKNRENKKKGSPWQPSPVSFFLAELDLRVAASIFPIPLSFLRCSAPHTTKMALVMRIKFPPTYPLIYKTLRIDSKLTTAEAIQFISETLNVAVQGNVGLYIPQERLWLDQNTPLSQYAQLQEVVRLPFVNSLFSRPKRSIIHLQKITNNAHNQQPTNETNVNTVTYFSLLTGRS